MKAQYRSKTTSEPVLTELTLNACPQCGEQLITTSSLLLHAPVERIEAGVITYGDWRAATPTWSSKLGPELENDGYGPISHEAGGILVRCRNCDFDTRAVEEDTEPDCRLEYR